MMLFLGGLNLIYLYKKSLQSTDTSQWPSLTYCQRLHTVFTGNSFFYEIVWPFFFPRFPQIHTPLPVLRKKCSPTHGVHAAMATPFLHSRSAWFAVAEGTGTGQRRRGGESHRPANQATVSQHRPSQSLHLIYIPLLPLALQLALRIKIIQGERQKWGEGRGNVKI